MPRQHVTVGTVAPTAVTPPGGEGDHYIDSVTRQHYIANGTASGAWFNHGKGQHSYLPWLGEAATAETITMGDGDDIKQLWTMDSNSPTFTITDPDDGAPHRMDLIVIDKSLYGESVTIAWGGVGTMYGNGPSFSGDGGGAIVHIRLFTVGNDLWVEGVGFGGLIA